MRALLAGDADVSSLFEIGAKLTAEFGAENVYNFSIGNPGLNPPQEVYDAIDYINHEMDPHLVHSYTPNSGFASTRKAVADNLNRRFSPYFDEDHIVMTDGGAAASNAVLRAVLDAGDKQVVFAPYFMEYPCWAKNYHASTIVVPANEENGFEPDADELAAVLDEDVKLVLINSPNNPTGAVYSAGTIKRIAEVLEAAQERFGHPIYLLSDEPYREINFTDREVPFIPDYYDNTIIAYAWSKSLSIPGDRIGYVAIPKQAHGSDELYRAVTCAARMLGCVNAPAVSQLIAERCIDVQVDVSYYKENAEALYKIVSEAGFTAIVPQGAFYLWVKSPVADEHEFLAAANAERIIGIAGSAFDGPGWVRLSFCVSRETILNSRDSFMRLGKKYFG